MTRKDKNLGDVKTHFLGFFVFVIERGEEIMTRAWIKVVIAAVFEVLWVIGLKYSDTIPEYIGTFIAIFLSFYLMIKAGEKIAVGTVYAVFVGLGTTGTVIVDTLVFKQHMTLPKLIFVILLLIGIVGLKFVSDDKLEAK